MRDVEPPGTHALVLCVFTVAQAIVPDRAMVAKQNWRRSDVADLGERTQSGGARPVSVTGTPVLASSHAYALAISDHRRRNATRCQASRVGLAVVALLLCGGPVVAQRPPARINTTHPVREIDTLAAASASATTAIVGVTLIDGRGGPALPNAVVVVRGDRISAVGSRAATVIPFGAAIIGGSGRTLLPGLIDAHFHLDGDDALPALFLSHGVTSVRDPGAWIEAYADVRRSG